MHLAVETHQVLTLMVILLVFEEKGAPPETVSLPL